MKDRNYIRFYLLALDLADKVEVSKDLLNAKLPQLNYKVLKFLMKFLSEVKKNRNECLKLSNYKNEFFEKVANNSSKNRMDAKNLSYVFGPNFLRPKNGVDYGLIDVERINNFVELLIKYYSDIFITSD